MPYANINSECHIPIRDYIVNEGNCLVVSCNDSNALRAAITRLTEDREFRTRLGESARSFAEQQCSPEALATIFENIFGPLGSHA